MNPDGEILATTPADGDGKRVLTREQRRSKRQRWRRNVKLREREARVTFYKVVGGGPVIWNTLELQEKLGQTYEEVGARLEALAAQRRWKKLRDYRGVVKAIGEPASQREGRSERAV